MEHTAKDLDTQETDTPMFNDSSWQWCAQQTINLTRLTYYMNGCIPWLCIAQSQKQREDTSDLLRYSRYDLTEGAHHALIRNVTLGQRHSRLEYVFRCSAPWTHIRTIRGIGVHSFCNRISLPHTGRQAAGDLLEISYLCPVLETTQDDVYAAGIYPHRAGTRGAHTHVNGMVGVSQTKLVVTSPTAIVYPLLQMVRKLYFIRILSGKGNMFLRVCTKMHTSGDHTRTTPSCDRFIVIEIDFTTFLHQRPTQLLQQSHLNLQT